MKPGRVRRIILYSLVTPVILVLSDVSTPADEPDSSKSGERDINYTRLTLAGIGASGVHWLGYRYLDSNWWDGDETVRFRVVHDWSGDSLLNLDHCGHLVSGIFLAQTAGDLYSWIGFRRQTAVLLGSLSSIAELLYIEYRDGRSISGDSAFRMPRRTCSALWSPLCTNTSRCLERFNSSTGTFHPRFTAIERHVRLADARMSLRP